MTQKPTGRQETGRRSHPEMWRVVSGTSFAGKVTLPSGSATVDAVYPALNTPDLVFFNAIPASLSGIASNTGVVLVTSLTYNPGSGVITFGMQTGVAAKWDHTIHWYTVRTA